MANEDIIPKEGSSEAKSVKILLDGEEMDAKYNLESIIVHKEVNRIPHARICLFDGSASEKKFEISDSGAFDPGKMIEIKAGYGGRDELIFKGVIVRQGVRIGNTKKNSVLKIEAKDEYYGLCLTRMSRYFYKSTDTTIIEDILAEHKKMYSANLSRKYTLKNDIEDTKLEHDEMVQYYSTDWLN
jgi:phage protein D